MEERQYRYEMHLHTAEGSRCADRTVEEQLTLYRDLGYAGVCLTDHFLNSGSCTLRDREGLTWDEIISHIMLPYHKAQKITADWDMDVFFGFEYTCGGTDFCIYGIGEDWLRAHPDQLSWKPNDYFDAVRTDGGFVVQAHPFREARYIDCIRLYPRSVDGVEIRNANRTAHENHMAEIYAREYGLPVFAGGDNHHGIQMYLAGIQTPMRYHDILSLCRDTTTHPEWLFFVDHPLYTKPTQA